MERGSCGAMKAVLDPSQTEEMPSVRQWLAHAEATKRIIKDHYGHLSGTALQTAATEENVLVQLENLQTHPSVRSALKTGRIRLHGWVYKMETGEVFAYDPDSGQFNPLHNADGCATSYPITRPPVTPDVAPAI